MSFEQKWCICWLSIYVLVLPFSRILFFFLCHSNGPAVDWGIWMVCQFGSLGPTVTRCGVQPPTDNWWAFSIRDEKQNKAKPTLKLWSYKPLMIWGLFVIKCRLFYSECCSPQSSVPGWLSPSMTAFSVVPNLSLTLVAISLPDPKCLPQILWPFEKSCFLTKMCWQVEHKI